MGKGFRMERAPAEEHPTCLIFATGSGISPIKALIESGELDLDQRQDVRLYYGTANEDTTAYLDDVKQWQQQGVKATNVYSDEGKGYVQDVFAKDSAPLEGSKTCAVMVGQKEMCEALTKLLEERGVSKDKVLLNF
jgi:ferredoxin-NADP reductase